MRIIYIKSAFSLTVLLSCCWHTVKCFVFLICTLIKEMFQFLFFTFLSQLMPNALRITSKLERPSKKLKTKLTLPNCRHPALFYVYFNFRHLLRVCAEWKLVGRRGKGERMEKHQQSPKQTEASKEEKKKRDETTGSTSARTSVVAPLHLASRDLLLKYRLWGFAPCKNSRC